MTSVIPIFALMMLVMINHSTDSGAVSKSNPHQNFEIRKSRSFEKSKTGHFKKDLFPAKNYQRSAVRGQKPFKKGQKMSAKMSRKKNKMKLTKKHQESAIKSQQQMELKDFRHCDYIDLREVGHRQCSDCRPGGKFLFQVLFRLFCFVADLIFQIILWITGSTRASASVSDDK